MQQETLTKLHKGHMGIERCTQPRSKRAEKGSEIDDVVIDIKTLHEDKYSIGENDN